MTKLLATALLALGMGTLAACGGGKSVEKTTVSELSGGVNPYLWRATLDTLGFLPLVTADPVGGIINFDWKSFPDTPDERMKATAYILDTRLRADGINVVVFRQTNVNGEWRDAIVDPDTAPQIENQILSRARQLRVADLN